MISFFRPLLAGSDKSGTCGDNVTWMYSETTRTLTIFGSGNMFNYARGWFNNYTDVNKVVIESGISSIGSYVFQNCSGLTSITIPNSVTSIEGHAFYADRGCSSLASITIPNSVTRIGDAAFWGCCRLTSITIPNSVTRIENHAFGCSSLTSITVESGNSIYYSSDNCNAIIEKATNSLILGCRNTAIPNSVTSIGQCAFSGCSSLTSITIPNSVTSIKSSAFSGCSGLTSITIPNSVTRIESHAFSGCSNLTSITIPNSVTRIESYAFSGCSNLTSITIPNSEKNIEISAFDGSTSLLSDTPSEELYDYESDIFSDETYCKGTLYVPKGTKDLYTRSCGWWNFLNIKEKPSEVAGL